MEDIKKMDGRYLLSWRIWVFALAALGLNLGLSAICSSLNLPIYLDTLGTLLTGALCGAIPGMFVAMFTAGIKGAIWNMGNTYYCIVTTQLAIFAYTFSKRHDYKKIKGYFISLLSMTFVSGALGGLQSWLLAKFSISPASYEWMIDDFISAGIHPFFAQCFVCTIYSLFDLTITHVMIFLFLRFAAPRFGNKLTLSEIYVWNKKADRSYKYHNDYSKLSARAVILTFSVNMAIAVVVGLTAGAVYRQKCITNFSSIAKAYSASASYVVDGDELDTFLTEAANGEEVSSKTDYMNTEKKLNSILSNTKYISTITVCVIDASAKKCHLVFDVEKSGENLTCGSWKDLDTAFYPYLENFEAGEGNIPYVITNNSKSIKFYTPVRALNGTGKTVAYASASVDITSVNSDIGYFLGKLFSLLLSISFMAIYIAYYYMSTMVIKPVGWIVKQASEFDRIGVKKWLVSEEWQNRIVIDSNDDIENLYKIISRNEVNICDSFDQIEKQTAVMLRMERNIVTALADMVESRDENTGDHVKRTSLYVRIISDEMLKERIYPETLNKDYAEKLVQAAPLHDIGKIKISDTILNKPGKLTPEEFNMMKEHTIEGGKIIDEALKGISGDSYLEVAKEVAMYHHERWDGTGYMKGLKGENIPLSARIMAVADVFDALVSKRSYKEPFSYEEALKIIKEETGTHFDPLVIKAFMNAQDKVKESLKIKSL
jgi:HD-GYP domain-containing protein (c-di-GMP phosphodiesterase class II)